jgi:hypothetical protein
MIYCEWLIKLEVLSGCKLFLYFSPKKIRTGKEEIACLDVNFELDLCFNPTNKMVLAIGSKA